MYHSFGSDEEGDHVRILQSGKFFESCGCLHLVCRDDIGSDDFAIYKIMKGSFVWSIRIPGKSLDEGLVPLISHQDVLSLLKYVPSYKEIEVYVEKHTIDVVFGKGKGVVIEEIMEDDEVNEANETGYRGQPLLLNENDVQNRNMDSTSKVDHQPWSSRSLSDSDISDHPPSSSKSMNEKGIKGEKQDPYHEDDEGEENAELFAELDDLLKRLPFLNDELIENVVGVDASVVVVEEQVERIEHVVDEEIKYPRKRKRENKDKSVSANVLSFGMIKLEEKVESSLEGREDDFERLSLFPKNCSSGSPSFKMLIRRVIALSSDVDSKGKRFTFPNSSGSPSFKKRKHVVLDEGLSSPKFVPNISPTDEACKTLFRSLASTKDPGDSDPFLPALSAEVFRLRGEVEALKDKLDLVNQERTSLGRIFFPHAIERLLSSDHLSSALADLQEKAMLDFDPNVEQNYDRAIESFYQVKFPHMDLLVNYAGHSVGKLMTLKPPIISFGNASAAGPSASPFL
uniref:Uncharacterized protein n=1 Tax=Tanacetum cinerariifolium TaxID=118510 RepID=A0A6L2J2G7_TANCI|nr:hypothetical protein [Tanacetum cinerariifolium]